METQALLDMELDLSSGKHCEMEIHRVDGKLTQNHSDDGPLWILEIEAPCCKTSARTVMCDKVHTHLMDYLDKKHYVHDCTECGKSMTFKEAYKGSVRWG